MLNKNRDNIVDAFGALKKLAMVTSNVLSKTKVDFAADLKGLYSVVKALNDNRKDFVTSLQLLLTFPFPNFGIKQAVRGDYLNVFTTFDLTLRRLGETFFTTSYALDPNMMHMAEVLNPPDFLIGELANLSGQAADPFKIPPGTAADSRGAAMIDRLTKIQLAIFAVITVITLTVMGIFYLRLPATFGLGTYGVSADFVAGGGLYKNANVTYRGVAVGRVESVALNPSGVTAEMRLNSGTPVPANVIATREECVGHWRAVHRPGAAGESGARQVAQRIADRPAEHPNRPGRCRPAASGRDAGQQPRRHPASRATARGVHSRPTAPGRSWPDWSNRPGCWSTRPTPTIRRSRS